MRRFPNAPPTDPDVRDYRIRFLGSGSFNQTRSQSGNNPISAQLCYPKHSAEVALIRFVVSKYLPYFPPMDRYARLHLPYSGSLGSHFPTLPISVIFNTDRRYYVPLRLPNVRLRFVHSSLSAPDTLFAPLLSLTGLVRAALSQCQDFASLADRRP